MEPVTITIANQMSMIPVIQASVSAYCKAAGAGEKISGQMELVIEEIVTNVIRHEYLPGQRETITLIFSLQGGSLELLVRFQGIPFDVVSLKQWENKTGIDQIVDSGGRGVGLRLIGQFCDDVSYRNLGWQGQEIRVLCSVPLVENQPLPEEEIISDSQSGKVVLRRMRPGDEAAISKLAYFAYRYTYIREAFYEPEQVRLCNADGRMVSYVITDAIHEEIIGHMALFADELFVAVPELAAGFVHPHFRRSGSFNDLTERMVRDAKANGWQGVCGMAVTSHCYSQLAALRAGLREAGVFVSHVRPLSIANIKDQAISRESFLYLVKLFDQSPRRPYYAPSRHREMIARIAQNASITVTFAAASVEAPLTDPGEMDARTNSQKCGHLVIRRWGCDTLHQVGEVLRCWCLDRLETIYLYLPMNQAATAVYSTELEDRGFFFAGLMPGHAGVDWLVVQYLNNQRYDYSVLQAATPFGKDLIEYVWNCDPSSCGNLGTSKSAKA